MNNQVFELALSESVEDVIASIREFNAGATKNPDRALKLFRGTTYWAFDSTSKTFGPSKFVAFAGMTFRAYDEALVGRRFGRALKGQFSGSKTRECIEGLMGRSYQPDPALAGKLRTWGEGLLGAGAFGAGDGSRWQFIVLE